MRTIPLNDHTGSKQKTGGTVKTYFFFSACRMPPRLVFRWANRAQDVAQQPRPDTIPPSALPPLAPAGSDVPLHGLFPLPSQCID